MSAFPENGRNLFSGPECGYWRLWGGTPALTGSRQSDPSATAGRCCTSIPRTAGQPGEYWLEVDGPGDMTARVPVRLH